VIRENLKPIDGKYKGYGFFTRSVSVSGPTGEGRENRNLTRDGYRIAALPGDSGRVGFVERVAVVERVRD
jgi:hypothetical protein